LEARRIALPVFTLTETCKKNSPRAARREVQAGNQCPVQEYFYRPVAARGENLGSYNNLQIVVDGNGAPWREACLYILSRLENSFGRASMKTYAGIADDLAAYRRFLDENKLDFTKFPQKKFHRPTYQYRGDLMMRIHASEIAPTTARRRMQTVIAFYRWLKSEGLITPKNAMWLEKDAYIHFQGHVGQTIAKKVRTTDVRVKVAKQYNPFDKTIEESGKLKPLTIAEQEVLAETLLEIRNIEMTLIHLFALFTGSRIQTVLTLKVRHVQIELSAKAREMPIVCGPGTGIDTKFGKLQTLFIPNWLYEKLQVYSRSERAIRRRNKSERGDTEDSYLFLSSRGNPFYMDVKDSQRFDNKRSTRYEANGSALRVFIRDRVLPKMREKLGKDFHYKFHDLRATFGMNLSDSQMRLVEKGDIRLHDAREFVKTRMCHDSSLTTDRYLQFRKNNRIVYEVQKHYEDHLERIVDAVNGIETDGIGIRR